MKKIFLSLSIAPFILSGCISVSNKESKEDAKELQALVAEQEKMINECNSKIEALGRNEQGEALCDNLFPIYGLDQNYENEEINFYVNIPGSLNLEEQVKLLANKLSQFKFLNLPIEVLRIEEREDKKIAIINLKEYRIDEIEDKPSWRSGFFQGSAGGGATSTTLTKTFLQPDYEGEWIDGVEFYYQNFPLQGWDHVDLSGVKYRK